MAPFEKRATRRTAAKREKEKKPTIEEKMLVGMERLLEQGHRFGSLTVEQLITEAGVSRATFYAHFRDKPDLVRRLIRHVTDELVVSLGDWLSNAKQANSRDIALAAAGMVATFKKHQAILAAIDDTTHDESVQVMFQDMINELAKRARSSLRIVKKRGAARAGVTDDVAEVVTWMVTLYCVRFINKFDGADLDRLGRTMGYISAAVAFAEGQ